VVDLASTFENVDPTKHPRSQVTLSTLEFDGLMARGSASIHAWRRDHFVQAGDDALARERYAAWY